MKDAERNATEDRRRREAVETRLTAQAKVQDSTLHVQVIPLYNGGRYAAYTFRTYDDVRLVLAPELSIGFFGGEWDNFTYPRYNLDMAFFRVYDAAERTQIIAALERTGGKVNEAARLLNVSRTTLWEKMQRLGL